MPAEPTRHAAARRASPPGRLSWAELRLTGSAPRPYGGFTSTWVRVPVGGLRLHVRRRFWPAAGTEYVMVHGLAVAARLLPRAATVEIPGAAHTVATTAGRQVALVADRFLDRTAIDRTAIDRSG